MNDDYEYSIEKITDELAKTQDRKKIEDTILDVAKYWYEFGKVAGYQEAIDKVRKCILNTENGNGR